MTNSHIVEALAHAAEMGDRSLRPVVVELLNKFIRMMFMKGDVRYPNCYEHYHPLSGWPCVYRGVNDYQHSWVVDLIIKYVVGLRPLLDGRVVIDPFPFEIRRMHADRIPYQGHFLRVDMDEEKVSLYVDGRLVASEKRGERIEVQIEPV
jgi:hypothetical protein